MINQPNVANNVEYNVSFSFLSRITGQIGYVPLYILCIDSWFSTAFFTAVSDSLDAKSRIAQAMTIPVIVQSTWLF
jgi:hypothetical protein